MKPEVDANKVVVLSGSGISAESGLPTFRDSNGLWKTYSWQEVASPAHRGASKNWWKSGSRKQERFQLRSAQNRKKTAPTRACDPR